MSELNLKKASLISLGGAVIIAGGIIGASAMLRRPSLNVNSTRTSKYVGVKTVTVKGVAEKEVTSDLGAFEISIYCNSDTIPGGYADINRINDTLLKKLVSLNIPASSIESQSVDYEKCFREHTEKEGQKTIIKSEFSHYRFTRTCRIVSKDVHALANAAIKLNDLISDGIEISISPVRFFISNPEQYKLELVDSASASAYQRAKTVAEKSGAELGVLQNARQGVIQITRVASNDTSDYGMYDTSSVQKIMRLVVTLEFSLK
ncbi:MAG: DUF541 domain-containing protein [Lentisphaerae bacterium]|nr:DUF541 domain-containing protein [Lentisphaerota bacterium]